MPKQLYLISSIFIAVPTMYDFESINVYYTTDGLADVLVILTIYLIPLSLISNWNNIKSNLYFELIFYLGLILVINLICQDMVSFYIYFEIALVPLFVLINLYGARNKNKAADYILIYTLFSSLFMLLGIVTYDILLNNTDYQTTSLVVLSVDLQTILFMAISIGIAVKTPLIPVHTWLPVVHSESPLAGSILLAGVILKLAVYAIIRLLLPTLSDAVVLFTPLVYLICVITIVYTSIVTLRQTDLKVIIAYSSISHLAVCISGVFSNTLIGIKGSLILSIAHGFVSPGLFIIVGGILYDRYHNRLIYYFNGLISYLPYISLYLIIFSFCNIGTPLSLNFIGEVLCLTGTINRSPVIGIISAVSVLLSASYQMKLTNRLTGGVKTPYLSLTTDMTFRETTLMLFLIIPTIYYGIWPQMIINTIYETTNLLYII